jgi:hypothetical protein
MWFHVLEGGMGQWASWSFCFCRVALCGPDTLQLEMKAALGVQGGYRKWKIYHVVKILLK